MRIIPGLHTPSCSHTWSIAPAFPRRSVCFVPGTISHGYEDVMNQQIKDVIAKRGPGDLNKILHAGDTWEVR